MLARHTNNDVAEIT